MSRRTIAIAGDSRRSLVLALKVRPHTADRSAGHRPAEGGSHLATTRSCWSAFSAEHRDEQREVVVDPVRGVQQRGGVFGEAGATPSGPGVEELETDSRGS